MGKAKDFYNGKIIIVTGGASGIGFEMAKFTAEGGGIVYLADIDIRGARKKAASLKKRNLTVFPLHTDVSSESEIREMLHSVCEEQGRIDILINNAGIGLDGEFKDMDLESWRVMMDVNFWGVLYSTHHAYGIMLKQGYGQIANVSSIAGIIPRGLMTS